MKIHEQEYEIVPIGSIKPYPNNVRVGDDEAIDESIEELGFFGACLCQKSTRYILVGNNRYRRAKATGATEIPVIWLDVDDETAQSINLADNGTSDLAKYRNVKLGRLLEELQARRGTLRGTAMQERFEELRRRVNLRADRTKDRPAQPDDLFKLLNEWTVEKPKLFNRKGVLFTACRRWLDKEAMRVYRELKHNPESGLLQAVAGEISKTVARMFGPVAPASLLVVSVPPGHSKKTGHADFAGQLAARVAKDFAVGAVSLFEIEGEITRNVSHPIRAAEKTFRLTGSTTKNTLYLLLDDVATSGHSIEQCANLLRAQGVMAAPLCWIHGEEERSRVRASQEF